MMANGTASADSSSSPPPSTLTPPPSEAISSPKTGRKPRAGGGPWSSIVRGEPDPVAPPSPPPSAAAAAAAAAGTIPTGELAAGTADTAAVARSDSSDETGINGGNAVGLSSKGEKKSAWNVPQNGGAVEGRPVMGAVLWPALSESTKASPKSSSSDLLAVASDGSQSVPPESLSPTPASKPSGNSLNLNNHGPPMKQKSMKRGSKGSSSGSLANGGPAPPSPTAPGEPTQTTSTRASSEPELSPREHNKNGGNWDHATSPRPGGFSPVAHGRNEHHRSYGGGGHRRNNNPGGANQNNNFSRRDQDRGSSEWNAHPNFRGRDVQLPQQHQQRAPQRPFLRGPIPGPPPFVNPPSPVRAFVNPLAYPDMHPQMYYIPTPPPPPEVFRPMPYVAPPIFIHHANPQLAFAVLKQIEFYFSPENLCKDVYLRQNMDGEGWVPLKLVASFNRVRQLTVDMNFVLESVCSSTVLEVQGDRIRKRGDWINWIWRPSAGLTDESLTPRMRNMDLDGTGGQGDSSNHS